MEEHVQFIASDCKLATNSICSRSPVIALNS
jgi:hypothetical protein